jgi:hypothetical protein
MPNEPWYESSNPSRVARGGTWRIFLWILACLAFIGLIVGIVYGVKVLTAPVRGAGDQEIIVNDGRNRVNAQEWFENQYNLILATDQKLDQAAADAAAHPNDSFYQTNYTGLKNRCIDMVAAYNAEAQKVSRGDWRSADLPAHINNTDPRTDCKETAR